MISFFKSFIRLPMSLQRLLATGVIIFGSLMMSAQAATVSVSNYPLFLLSQAVTEGAPSAKQLLQAGEVGHHGSISPGDIKAIQDSKFVVWFGEPLENNLASTLNSAPNAIALFKFDAFKRHPLRDIKGKPLAGTLDPHIWLDPDMQKPLPVRLPSFIVMPIRNIKRFIMPMRKNLLSA